MKKYLDLEQQYGKTLRAIVAGDKYLRIIYRESQNDEFKSDIISGEECYRKYIKINHNHIITAKKYNEKKLTYIFGNANDEYLINDIWKTYETFNLNLSGANGNMKVVRIINELGLTNFNMAEIGVQYGSTTQLVLDNCKVKKYDLYDQVKIDLLKDRFGKYDFVRIIEGNAEEMLDVVNDIVYNVVFYDCSHRYEIDIKIVKKLLHHLNKRSVVIFHDYDMIEVRKMIEEFCTMFDGTVYALDGNKVLKLK